MSCAEVSVRGLVSAGTGAAWTVDPESPGLGLEELGLDGTLGSHLSLGNGKGCQSCLLAKMSLSRLVGCRRHPGAVAGVLTGCCALGHPDGC